MESPCLICTPIQDSILDTREKSDRVESTLVVVVAVPLLVLLLVLVSLIDFFLFFLFDRK